MTVAKHQSKTLQTFATDQGATAKPLPDVSEALTALISPPLPPLPPPSHERIKPAVHAIARSIALQTPSKHPGSGPHRAPMPPRWAPHLPMLKLPSRPNRPRPIAHLIPPAAAALGRRRSLREC